MRLSGPGQDGVPSQRRSGAEGLVATLALLTTGTVDQRQQLLPFRLPVAQPCSQQRPCQHNAPFTPLLAHADIDELRIEHHLAKAFLHRFHRRLSIARAIEGNGLDIDHGVAGLGQRLTQIIAATNRQHQPRVTGQRRQLQRCLPGATLSLAAVAVDRINQLLRLAGLGCNSKRQRHGQAGKTQNG
ncbi:hypothetical protein D3C78_1030860 [compost metagenome]